MKVLAIVPYLKDTAPGQRFRIEQWKPLLEKNGISISYASFEDNFLKAVLYQHGKVLEKASLVVRAFGRRWALLKEIKSYDLIYLYRAAALIGPAWIERSIANKGVPIVYDFDDAIFKLHTSLSNHLFGFLKFPGKTAEICSLSKHVIVGNSYLENFVLQHNPNVTVIPTTIDTERHKVRSFPINARKLVIGWTGSHTTLPYLNVLRNVLPELSRRCQFSFHVIGVSAYQIPAVQIISQPWRLESEIQDLHKFDIGVMPMPDDEWSRGKCGLKVLQYMALGIPAVCSPVGVNTEIVQDGQNGFLARDSSEWLEKLALLLNDGNLRIRLGKAGRETVEKFYSAQVWMPKIKEIFESVAGKS